MGTRALGLLVIGVGLLPRLALAQGIFAPVSGELSAYYDGALYSYEVSYTDNAQLAPVDSIVVNLSDYLEVVRVEEAGGDVLFDRASLAACDTTAVGPPYACAASVPCQSCSLPRSARVDVVGGAQEVTFASGFPDSFWPTFLVTVRLRSGGSCVVPSASFENGGIPSSSISDNTVATACSSGLAPLNSLATTPASPVSVPRTPVGSSVALAFAGDAASGAAVVNALLFDAATFDSIFQCAVEVSPGVLGPFSGCRQPPASDLFQLAAVNEFPAAVNLQALNTGPPAGPKPGGGRLRVSFPGAPPTDIDLTIERDVVALAIGTASGSLELAGTGQLQLVVTDARNVDGGFEPFMASYAVVATSPASYATTVSPMLNAATGELRVAAPVPEPVAVTVRGTHANPSGGSVSDDLVITLLPPKPTCFIEAPAQLGVGARTELHLVAQAADGSRTPLLVPASWSVSEGAATVAASSNGSAVLQAGRDPGTVVVVAGGLPTDACDASTASATVAVTQDVLVRLVTRQRRVEPGRLLLLEAQVENSTGAPIDDLQFSIDVPRSLRLVRVAHVSGSGMGGQEQPSLDTTMGSRTSALRGSSLPLQLPASPAVQVMQLALLAKPGFGCGRVRVGVALLRAGIGIADDAKKIELSCEPELTQATVVGRVFVDSNGDGVQQTGEVGLPGVTVAVSSGVYAVTDRLGSYHIERLSPGRQAVKLDASSLPVDAQAVGAARRDITLTAGGFVRVSFGVRLPELANAAQLDFHATGSGVGLHAGGLVYVAQFRLRGAEQLTATQDGVHIAGKRMGELWQLELPMQGGEYWLLTATAVDGRKSLFSFAVHDYAQNGGHLVVPRGPRFVGALALPVQPVAKERLAVPLYNGEGVTLSLGVDAKEPACSSDKPGPWRCSLPLGPANSVSLVIDAAADESGENPPPLSYAANVTRGGSEHFLVALGGVEVGHTLEHGDAVTWDGGGAFFYRGLLAGGWQLVAGADARARPVLLKENGKLRSLSGALQRLFGHDPTRVFRDLEENQFYPTYGDGAVVVDEREAGGRLFFRLQRPGVLLKWGGVRTGIDGVEVGQFVRSFYGLGGRWRVAAEKKRLAVDSVAFAARPDSVAARDRLLVTGGSLYFLSNRDVVEGSVHVTLEVLDEISRLPIRAVPLVENIDYDVDYLGGRVTLDAGLPYRSSLGAITSAGAGGRTAQLIVAYEYLPTSLAKDWTLGGRSVGTWGPFQLGATAVAELRGDGDGGMRFDPTYELFGATARMDEGPLRLRLELARSIGNSLAAAFSSDGGLRFANQPAADSASGNAALLEVGTQLDGFLARGYGRFKQSGFADSRNPQGQRLLQAGARLQATVGRRSDLWGQLDHRQLRYAGQPLSVQNTALFGAAHRISRWRFALEGRYEAPRQLDLGRAIAGMETGVRLSSSWEVAARRRQLLWQAAGQHGRSETSVLTLYELPARFTAGVEAGVSDSLKPFGRLQASAPLVDGTEIYGSYRVGAVSSEWLEDAATNRFVTGGRRRLVDDTQAYAEEQLAIEKDGKRGTRLVGIETPIGQRLRFSLSYQRGAIDERPLAPRLVRDAGSAGLLWTGERLFARMVADARYDAEPGADSMQLGAQARVEVLAADALTLAMSAAGASGYAVAASTKSRQQAWEGTVGFALRPPTRERLQVFGRYALSYERRPDEGSSTWLSETSHVAALAVLVQVAKPFDVGPKLYFRHSTAALAGVKAREQALLAALRGDWHVWNDWNATVEGRSCAAFDGGPLRFGALVEASVLALPWMRLGGGYNFSDIAAAGVRCEEPGSRGFFVRAEAVY